MSEQFVDLLKELFPPISNDTRESLKKIIVQHKDSPHLIFSGMPTSSFSQGDIFSNIPFLTLQSNGEYLGERMFGMLISNTCDFENNSTILLAPAYSIDFFKECFGSSEGTLGTLKKNLIYDKFYLPSFQNNPELIVDFNGINSFETDYIWNVLKETKSSRIASLNQTGYYYLISKLTVHFLRPESKDLFREELKSI